MVAQEWDRQDRSAVLHSDVAMGRRNDCAVSDPERADQYVWLTLDSETKAVLNHYIAKCDGFSA